MLLTNRQNIVVHFHVEIKCANILKKKRKLINKTKIVNI